MNNKKASRVYAAPRAISFGPWIMWVLFVMGILVVFSHTADQRYLFFPLRDTWVSRGYAELTSVVVFCWTFRFLVLWRNYIVIFFWTFWVLVCDAATSSPFEFSNRYSLSSERLVDIKVIKFCVEEGVASARKIFEIYHSSSNTFAMKLCSKCLFTMDISLT
jgi:hypothetical protein